jgi:hypothetical protein
LTPVLLDVIIKVVAKLPFHGIAEYHFEGVLTAEKSLIGN